MHQCEINLISSILNGPIDISILMPGPAFRTDPQEFYENQKKYKVLWVLHGGNNDRYCFLNATNLKRHVDGRDVIVVMPNALNSDFANHPEFADGYYYQDFFFRELMPYVYHTFPASDAPEDNFIVGFSMGAAAAWMYALSHPGKFGAIAPIGSGLKDYSELEKFREMKSGEFRAAAEADRMLFTTGYGPAASGIKPKEINMVAKYPTVGDFLDSPEHTQYTFEKAAKAGTVPKVYLPCGTKDGMYAKVLKLKELAQNLGVESITFDFVEDGVGNYEFVDSMLPKTLDFFGL
ncbi:MAG: esterase family protein [Lachnospiraceae bacterium]|nr:esterase family protein [Lachnospiraceae bacterium]